MKGHKAKVRRGRLRRWSLPGLFLVLILPCAAQASGDPEGHVRQVYGDLTYIDGLDGQAPLWSSLKATGSGASLEVIRELPGQVVTRVTNGLSARTEERVVVIRAGGDGNGGMARRRAAARRVSDGPRMDGRLDDPVWSNAKPVTGFVQ